MGVVQSEQRLDRRQMRQRETSQDNAGGTTRSTTIRARKSIETGRQKQQ